jgi:hypothetical protein
LFTGLDYRLIGSERLLYPSPDYMHEYRRCSRLLKQSFQIVFHTEAVPFAPSPGFQDQSFFRQLPRTKNCCSTSTSLFTPSDPPHSLPENSALPCVVIARQRTRNARQSLCLVSMHGKEYTVTSRTATRSLPCVVPYTHGKALCRAIFSLPCVNIALPWR